MGTRERSFSIEKEIRKRRAIYQRANSFADRRTSLTIGHDDLNVTGDSGGFNYEETVKNLNKYYTIGIIRGFNYSFTFFQGGGVQRDEQMSLDISINSYKMVHQFGCLSFI